MFDRRALFLAAAVLACDSALRAGVIVVPSAGFDTIQSGINAASSGDTVKVRPGHYNEILQIPPGKDGMTLVGKGTVVIDARIIGGAGIGPGLRVQSAGVTVKRLTFRHAKTGIVGTGNGIAVMAAGCVLESLDVQHAVGAGIFVDAANCVVRGCRIRNCRGQGIRVDHQPGATIERCSIANCMAAGIEINGANARVSRCAVTACELEGVFASGASVVVERTRVTHSFDGVYLAGAGCRITRCRVSDVSLAYHVIGDDALVSSCRADDCDDGGAAITGDRATVEHCVFRDLEELGIYVNGDAPDLHENRLENVRIADGIAVNAASSGTIERNVVLGATHTGIEIDSTCSNLQILDNRVSRAGAGVENAGFHLAGSAHTLGGNRATDCALDGFYVACTLAYFQDNVARGNGEDGFDVDANGDFNAFIHNRAIKNAAEGFENGGGGTHFENNTCTGNRIDVANDGAFSFEGGNKFSSGGPAKSAEVDL